MKLDGEVAQKFEKPVYIREYNLAEHLFVSQHATWLSPTFFILEPNSIVGDPN